MKHLLLSLLLCSGIAQAEVRVEDYQGNDVVLAKPAQRVIGLAPHVIENLYSAGAGERVVGGVSYSDYPQAATRLPIVGDYSRTNYELISDLKPDLIVAWNSGRSLDVVKKLRDLGFTVYVDEPHTLEDIARSIRDMGVLMGTEQASEAKADEFLQRVSEMRMQYADVGTQEVEWRGRPKSPVSVLYQVWMEPLQTLNGDHIISDVIRLCGGRNVFEDEHMLAPKVNIEAVIVRNPQVILSGGTDDDVPHWLKAWQRWPVLQAVKDKHIYAIPPDLISRHTVRILDGAQYMCDHLQKVRQHKD